MSAHAQLPYVDTLNGLATLIRVDDPLKWKAIVEEFCDNNYRQGWYYGLESADRKNAKIERMAIRCGTQLIGAVMVRLKSVPFLHTGMAYIGGGPLTRRGDGQDIRALQMCLSALRREYIDLRGYTLRVLPPLCPPNTLQAVSDSFTAALFDISPWPPTYRTLLVNIDRPLPDIRKTLAQKWRNCLNNAEKRGMEIRAGGEPELFEKFHQIFEQFMDRKQISVQMGADFYHDLRNRAHGDEGYYVCIAFSEGVPVAGQLTSMLGDTGITLLAATGEAGLKCKASNLLQWRVIVEAHRRGLRYFDLGGIEPETQPGVYHFKQGLGGQEVTIPGPFQAGPAGVRGRFVPAFERLYRWSRGHKLRA